MKRLNILTALFILAVYGCNKDITLNELQFEVSADKNVYNVGDSVGFNIQGNPDMITFYSGEIGKRFEYRNRSEADGIPQLQFSSLRANGTQPNSLRLMVSNDFTGAVPGDTVTTVANIAKATWTDITGRATLSTGSTVSSGIIDLSDFAVQGKPVYIGFKYVGVAGSVQNKWTITALTVKNVLPDATVYTIVNLSAGSPITNYGVTTTNSTGWAGYPVANTYKWSLSSNTSLSITGATTAASAANAESWAVSGSINLKRVSPDLGTPIKNTTENTVLATAITNNRYTYQYASAGEYNAVFWAGNVNINKTDSTSRTIKLTIR
jgi:hypothetical protein